MRAAGEIRGEDKTAIVRFGEVSFTVGLSLVRFGPGQLVLLHLRLRPALSDLAAVRGQDGVQGVFGGEGAEDWVEDLTKPERAVWVASRLKARLLSEAPARLNPGPGRKLDLCPRLEAALRRAEYLASRHDFRDLIGKDEDG